MDETLIEKLVNRTDSSMTNLTLTLRDSPLSEDINALLKATQEQLNELENKKVTQTFYEMGVNQYPKHSVKYGEFFSSDCIGLNLIVDIDGFNDYSIGETEIVNYFAKIQQTNRPNLTGGNPILNTNGDSDDSEVIAYISFRIVNNSSGFNNFFETVVKKNPQIFYNAASAFVLGCTNKELINAKSNGKLNERFPKIGQALGNVKQWITDKGANTDVMDTYLCKLIPKFAAIANYIPIVEKK